MELRKEMCDDICVLHPAGRVSFANGDQELAELVRAAMTEGVRKILIDFSKVSYIDSSGIGELVGCAVYIKEQRGELKLCGLNSRTFNLMKMVSLHSVFEVEDVDAEALLAVW